MTELTVKYTRKGRRFSGLVYEALATYLSPRFDRQFRDLNSGGVNDGHLSTIHILVVHHLLNGSFKSFVVWKLWDKEDGNNIIETERETM